MDQERAQRLRLLGVAGILAPGAMVLGGLLLGWLLRRELPPLLPLPGWDSLLLGAITAGLSMGLITLLYKSSKRFERALRESGTRVGEEALSRAGYPVMLLVVTMAALGEEVLFRGGLQPSLGIIPTALLFGFSHGGWRREMWAYVVAASLSGALFGTVYWLTGNLWAVIIAHALHNIFSTLMLGKRVEVAWRGRWPVIKLVPEVEEAEAAEAAEEAETADPHQRVAAGIEEATQHELGESVPAETDGPDDGADHRPASDRPPE